MERSSTFSNAAKTLFYNANGTGRDSYIQASHGGLVASQQRNVQPEKGTMDSRDIHIHTISPVIHSKPIHYTSDGTGRDSYIVRSGGGLFNEYVPGSAKNGFYNSLRQYDNTSLSPKRSRSPGKKDFFMTSQSHFNSTQKASFRKMSNYQKVLDLKLSKPKYVKGKKEGE